MLPQANLQDSYTGAESGRASKWAAAIIEAKIHMKQQNWQAGLDKCLEIINSSPHELLPTYAEVFDPLNEYNAEIIWSLDFARDIEGIFDPAFPGRSFAGNNSWRPSMFNPRLRDEPLNTDERDALGAALSANGQAFNGTGLQVASKDFAEKFPMNDLRRELNIVDNYLGFDLVFPYMAKFWNLDLETSPRFNHSDNRMVFRLGDVHLMAAECENERKWELAAEATRRYDLIRWGILLDVVQNLEYRFWHVANSIAGITAKDQAKNVNLLLTHS